MPRAHSSPHNNNRKRAKFGFFFTQTNLFVGVLVPLPILSCFEEGNIGGPTEEKHKPAQVQQTQIVENRKNSSID